MLHNLAGNKTVLRLYASATLMAQWSSEVVDRNATDTALVVASAYQCGHVE